MPRARDDGHVGPIYPVMWRGVFRTQIPRKFLWKGMPEISPVRAMVVREVDQIQQAIDMLKNNAGKQAYCYHRLASGAALAYGVAAVSCDVHFQCCQRKTKLPSYPAVSGDIRSLGIPFNLACYSALTKAIAQEVGLQPGTFAHYHCRRSPHLLLNHVDGLKDRSSSPVSPPTILPVLQNKARSLFDDLTLDDFTLSRGQSACHPIFDLRFAV